MNIYFLQASGGGGLGPLIFLPLMILVFWLFFIRPQAKRRHGSGLTALEPAGDLLLCGESQIRVAHCPLHARQIETLGRRQHHAEWVTVVRQDHCLGDAVARDVFRLGQAGRGTACTG